jgi:hypothetical protein
MRALHALGEWEQLSHLAQEKWFAAEDESRKMIAPLAAAAAWGLGQWELMDDYITVMKVDSPDGAFFRAILAVHRNLFGDAETYINSTRDLLDTELKALVGESYNRAYKYVIFVFSSPQYRCPCPNACGTRGNYRLQTFLRCSRASNDDTPNVDETFKGVSAKRGSLATYS